MLTYLFITSIGITILFLFYFIILRKETFFQLNRITILLGLVISLVFPTFELLNQDQKEIINSNIPVIQVPEISISESTIIIEDPITTWNTTEIVILVYSITACLLFIKFLISNILLIYFILKNGYEKLNKTTLVFTNGKYPTFAYLNFIFWDETKDLNEIEEALILKHEETHVKELHSIDIFLMELLKIAFWFHPAVYLIDAALRTQHEYIADQNANKTINDTSYRQLMVRSLFDELSVSVGHGFQFSTIKSRINMLKQQRSAHWKKINAFFTITFLITIITISQSCVTKDLAQVSVDPRLHELQYRTIYGYIYDGKTYWTSENNITVFLGRDEFGLKTISNFQEVTLRSNFPEFISDITTTLKVITLKNTINESLVQKIEEFPFTEGEYKADPRMQQNKLVEAVYPTYSKKDMDLLYNTIVAQINHSINKEDLGQENAVEVDITLNTKGEIENYDIVNSPNEILEEEVARAIKVVSKDFKIDDDKHDNFTLRFPFYF